LEPLKGLDPFAFGDDLRDAFDIVEGQWFGVVTLLENLAPDGGFQGFVGEQVLGKGCWNQQQKRPSKQGVPER
jgi:hypothetical protein